MAYFPRAVTLYGLPFFMIKNHNCFVVYLSFRLSGNFSFIASVTSKGYVCGITRTLIMHATIN
jgi:hypothetical protein